MVNQLRILLASVILGVICASNIAIAASTAPVGKTIAGISVSGKKQTCCGSELLSIIGQYKVTYTNKNLAWGDRIYLMTGFKKILPGFEGQKDVDWYVKHEREMTADGSWTWTINFEQVLLYARYGTVLTDMQFVFKIVHSDGSVSYDKGSDTDWGFYESASVMRVASEDQYVMCVDAKAVDADGYCELITKVVERD